MAALAIMSHLKIKTSRSLTAPTADATPALSRSFSSPFLMSTPRPPNSAVIHKPEPINLHDTKRATDISVAP